MGKVEALRGELRALPRADWLAFLHQHSGLPGPRGNIELGQAFAEEAGETEVEAALACGGEFGTFCGAIGLGRLLADRHRPELVERLRGLAGDQRWRVREGVAMALQRLGDAEPGRLHALASAWATDEDPLVQRAAAAGICEPRLLRVPEAAAVAVEVCRVATAALAARPAGTRREPGVRALRQALGYCWSVAVAADPGPGLVAFGALERTGGGDPDVAWVVRENLTKKRLARLR
ncbi:MAG: HEAT repeat domain-containing protein [Nocardioidaceae bacterium]